MAVFYGGGMRGIYVETRVHADADVLWHATQDLDSHVRWDLRFTSIELVGIDDAGARVFAYELRTPLATITGDGTTVGERRRPDGTGTSALVFSADQPWSPLQRGSAYWRYVPTDDGIRFLTGYDYEPPFGAAGRIVDRAAVRPVVGWLTARSFDALRLVARLRSGDHSRQVPILAVADFASRDRVLKALDLGVNDLIASPADALELRVRSRALIRRKRYADYLRDTVAQSMELAVTDQLTGLNNRRYMMGQLDALIERSSAGGDPVSLLMLDIDHFKRVNDTWGHTLGDEVLREVAVRLASSVRAVDIPCRYGGEEFVVVMPATRLTDAARIAERIRSAISAEPFAVGSREVPVTVSLGVSASDGVEDRPESLIRRADEALYEAKAAGRNQVVIRPRRP